jgi:hypothetical protein
MSYPVALLGHVVKTRYPSGAEHELWTRMAGRRVVLPVRAPSADQYRSRDFPGGVFVVPDVHGDLEALSEVLVEMGCCVRTNRKTVRWQLPRALLVFTGDVVDDLRPGSVPARAPDQEGQVMDFVVSLQQSARRKGSEVVFVAGNHEVGNVLNHTCCRMYLRSKHCRGDDHSTLRRLQVLSFLRKVSAKVAVVVDNVLLCHAGLTHRWIQQRGASVERWNRWFEATVLCGFFVPDSMLDIMWTRRKPGLLLPEWGVCAGDSVVRHVVVGHEIESRAQSGRCSGYCYLDVGMSRVFGTGARSFARILGPDTIEIYVKRT